MASLAEVAKSWRLRPRMIRYADETGKEAGKALARELEGRALPVGLKLGAGVGVGTTVGAAGGTYLANRTISRKKEKAKKRRS